MDKDRRQPGSARLLWVKTYVLGWAVGVPATLYGIVALAMGRTFLPGRHAHELLVRGRSGLALAAAYTLGGAYLLVRCLLEGRVRSEKARTRLYALENGILLGFLAALIYVLLHVGEAG